MWGTIIGAGITAASSLIGGKKSDDRNARNAQKAAQQTDQLNRAFTRDQYKLMREGAEAAGYNAAAALSVPAYTGSNVPVISSAFGDGISRAGAAIGDGFAELDRLKLAESELDLRERELDMREKAQERRTGQTSVFDRARASGTIFLGDNKVDRPKARPEPMSETIPVYNQAGKQLLMDKRLAERLRINPWDQIIQEDIEALYGDVVSEPNVLYHSSTIGQGAFGDPFAVLRPKEYKHEPSGYTPRQSKAPGMQSKPESGWMSDYFK